MSVCKRCEAVFSFDFSCLMNIGGNIPAVIHLVFIMDRGGIFIQHKLVEGGEMEL